MPTAAAEAGQGVLAQGAQGFARNHDRAGVGALQPRRDHEQRGLAGAGGADQADGLALTYMQVDVFEDMNARRAAPQRKIDAAEGDRGAAAPRPRGVVHVPVLCDACG